MSRGFASNYRTVLIAICLFGCFAGVGVRLVYLHVIDRDDLLKLIVKTRRQVSVDKARRGEIRDAHEAILATDRPQILVAVDPMMVRLEDEVNLPELARLLDVPVEEVRRKFRTKYRPVSLAKTAGSQTMGTEARAAAPDTMLKLNLPAPVPAVEKRDAAAGDAAADLEFGRAMVANNDEPTVDPKEVVAAAEPADPDNEVDSATDAQGRRPIRWAKLSDHVSESTYVEIEKLKIRGLCPPERRYGRVYPHNELAAHIVGFANKKDDGVIGVEAYTDFYLRGRDGWREGEKDGRRHELAQFQTRDVPRADGYTVVLSIDSRVQDLIEQELDKIAKTYQPLKATIVVSDPRTGFVLGMANYPTFNPNEYNLIPKDQVARMKNIAVSDVYEPGSVFKIVAASGALEEGLVTPDTEFNCGLDRIEYKGRELKLPGEDHHFGQLSVAEIIAHSSNRGAAQLAMKLGDERFEKYARAFGFGQTLGFPIGHESPGIFARREKWYPIDITRIPMGQSIAATALQMHQAMSTIANGGVLLKPQIVRELRDASGTVISRYAPMAIRRVVSDRTARTVAKLLEAVASPNGTAPEAAIKIGDTDYEVAGKTGTAQKYLPELQPNGTMKVVPSRKHHVVSFVGFFPASRPQVAISVIVDDADAHAPNGVAYGKAVAAPVFKSIGEKLIPILPITAPNQPARPDFVAATEGARR